MTNNPAVSVIIPMFNASKYVGQCLESLLAQTFQDFEVIVVDDCSTDSSCAVVESFASKFDGRLTLLQHEHNTGNGVAGRNTGLKFARGKYVFNMDNDDLLTLTALEELYTLAKNFDADVVCCEKYYRATENLGKILITSYQRGNFTDKPILETENLPQRAQKVTREEFLVTPWSKLVRRNLLVDNEIFFPPVKIADDDIWLFALLFTAKKFLRVPNVVYIWRQTNQSLLHREKSPQETINFWLSPLVVGLKTLDEMLGKIEFFRQNPQYRCALLEQLVHSKLERLFEASLELSPTEIYEAIKFEFVEHLGAQDVLVAWILTDLIVQQKIFVADRKRIAELERKLEEKLS